MYNSNLFTKKLNVVILAMLCMLLWGSAFPAVKIGYDLFDIGPDQTGSKIIFAGCRFFIAGFITMAIAHFSIDIKKEREKISKRNIMTLGFIQTSLQYIFFYVGLSNTTGSKGAIITGMGTFITVILAHFLINNDKMNRKKVIGCIIGFIGIVIINYSSTDLFQLSFFGEGFIFIAAIAFAVGAILSKEYTSRQNPILLTSYQMIFGGFLLITIGMLMGGRILTISVSAVCLLLYLAILSALAFTIWTLLIKYNPVGEISIYNALTPIFGTILSGVLLGDDVFNIKSIMALFCVSLGIFIVNSKK